MIVKPKASTWSDDDKIKTPMWQNDIGMHIECETISPESAVGRTVYLFIPAELATSMLRELRDYNRHLRSKPMNETKAEGA